MPCTSKEAQIAMATTAIVARFWGRDLFRPEPSGCGCLWQPARQGRETLPPVFFTKRILSHLPSPYAPQRS